MDISDRLGGSLSAWTVWFTGLSGSGKTTLARNLAARLEAASIDHEVLDGDDMRADICRDLGFTKEDRNENVRRIGYIANVLNRHNIVAIVAAISPYREARDQVRTRIPNFVEVHVDCPLAVVMARDAKGLYKRALSGEIKNVTGISDPYEPPVTPELYLNSAEQSPEEELTVLLARLKELGLLCGKPALKGKGA